MPLPSPPSLCPSLFFFSGILEFRIDGTPRLLIIPFFATLRNLIQSSPFINFGGFCQPPLLFQTPRLLIHVHSRHGSVKPRQIQKTV